MADNKQYITQKQDNGTVFISEDVVAAIVTHAIMEIEGVAGLNSKPGSDIAEFIGKKNWNKGLKITIEQDNSIRINANINIYYGYSVVDIANTVQAAIINAVNSSTGIKAKDVNVNICGIVRK